MDAKPTMPPWNMQPELTLLARVRQGDEEAFVALYRRHKDSVYRFALLRTGSAAKPVKGAPYSADISTEVSQTLADGNAISRKTSGRVYRDGEGRTHQETVVNGEAKSIQLRDPVGGTAVMLLPGSKKAVRMHMPGMHPFGGPLGGRLDGALLKSRGVTTSLGEKAFGGVKAEGKSTVHTIPAGEMVYRLTGIRRGEPPADLFKVPEEYAPKRGRG